MQCRRRGHGHPGSPISLAPIAYTLYQRFIKHDPNDPNWAGRDRFILSGGHASLTQYVQLYFSGYGLTLDDLKYFRGGADTRTPGHPEYGLTPGIEMTTGPLGQGVASAVGFAYGQRYERGLLDPDAPEGKSPFDHKVWVICGEGDIEEGVSGEASSLAGNEQLGNLFVFFDANHIQIEGETKIALDENVIERYKAYAGTPMNSASSSPTVPTRKTSKACPRSSRRPSRSPIVRTSSRSTRSSHGRLRARPTILRPMGSALATRPSRVSRRPSARSDEDLRGGRRSTGPRPQGRRARP